MLTKIKAAISGKKLYITAVVAIITAVVSWSQDAITLQQFVEAVFLAAGSIFLRAGIEKSGPQK